MQSSATLTRTGSLVLPEERNGSPVEQRNPRTLFSEQILKKVVGQDRASMALNSMSMGYIPGNFASTFNLNCKHSVTDGRCSCETNQGEERDRDGTTVEVTTHIHIDDAD